MVIQSTQQVHYHKSLAVCLNISNYHVVDVGMWWNPPTPPDCIPPDLPSTHADNWDNPYGCSL